MGLPDSVVEGKFEVLHKIGEGGMGEVYKVRHLHLDELCVIKVVSSAHAHNEPSRKRFLLEARASSKLRHPNIAEIRDFSVGKDGTAYIVMEFIDGLTLKDLLDKSGPPDLVLTKQIACQSLMALSYLHKQGFIHRDIAPDNLMLTRSHEDQPHVKLIDLGLTRRMGSKVELTAEGNVIGKPRYSAPERFVDQEAVDQRSDIYSFGVVFYELLTGRCPIEGEDYEAIIASHVFKSPLGFDVSDPEGRVPYNLRKLAMRALEKNPADRFPTADEFIEHLTSRHEKTTETISVPIKISKKDGGTSFARSKNIYQEWGFSENPFSTNALPATEIGEALLVGRDHDLYKLSKRLYTPPTIPTIEGVNGMGKTSLVNVLAYKCYADYVRTQKGPFLIPCNQVFQLNESTEVKNELATLKAKVFYSIAQTLLNNRSTLERFGRRLVGAEKVDRFLNSSEGRGFALGLTRANASASNDSGFQSYMAAGLPLQVRQWLEDVFPTPDAGAVICVLDNLELLQRYQSARTLLEEIRDPILRMPGVRWVMCGSMGILLGAAASPRLEGVMHSPITLEAISDDSVLDILSSRIRTFSVSRSPYLPIESIHFILLYTILRGNFRYTLNSASNFCLWVSDKKGGVPESREDKIAMFKAWLRARTIKQYKDVSAQLRPEVWRVFDQAVAQQGEFSHLDIVEMSNNNEELAGRCVESLLDFKLLAHAPRENDPTRKSLHVTGHGWFVNYGRQEAFKASVKP